MKLKHLIIFLILLLGIAYSNPLGYYESRVDSLTNILKIKNEEIDSIACMKSNIISNITKYNNEIKLINFKDGSRQSFGVNTGINLSKSKSFIADGGIASFFGGICYELDLFNNKHIAIGVEYYAQGNSSDFVRTDSLGIVLSGVYTAVLKYHYIGIPIKIGYKVNKLILSIGIDPSFFLVETVKWPEISDTGNIIGYNYSTSSDGINRLNLSALIELKVKIKLSEKIFLKPALTYRHSLTNILKNNHFLIKHRGLSLFFNLSYQINSKNQNSDTCKKTTQ